MCDHRHRARSPGRGLLGVSLLAAVSLVALSCGGDGDDGSSESTGDADPGYGGDVVYALEAETSGGWCIPESQLAQSGMIVARAIYDFLMVPGQDNTWVPYLAKSMEPNEDATQWTVSLRDGITFHDGTPLDSAVLKNNIDAWLGRYPNRTSLIFSFVMDNIDTVEIVDDLTVSVTTKVPWPALPAYFYGGGRLGIMAQAQLDDPDTCDRDLIGTGPYKLESWSVNERLSAVRNADYWATDDLGNQLPYLDRISFVPVPDAQTRVNGLLSGEFDMIGTSSAEATEVLEGETSSGNVELTQSQVNTEVAFTMLNEGKPPFDDEGARIALATATDRETYNEVVALGVNEIASGPFPPGAPGYLEDAGYPEFGLGRATDLVADYEARTGNPFEFTYVHANTEGNIRAAQFLQEMWQEAGMKVNLQTLEQAALINLALSDDWGAIAFRNFPAGSPDGNYVWWYTGSPVNFPKMSDPDVDRLLDEGRSELDDDTALEIYEELNRVMTERVHYGWLDWILWTIATRPGITGVMGPPLPDGTPPSQGLATGHSTAGLYLTE